LRCLYLATLMLNPSKEHHRLAQPAEGQRSSRDQPVFSKISATSAHSKVAETLFTNDALATGGALSEA
jgi:hypothetical protein